MYKLAIISLLCVSLTGCKLLFPDYADGPYVIEGQWLGIASIVEVEHEYGRRRSGMEMRIVDGRLFQPEDEYSLPLPMPPAERGGGSKPLLSTSQIASAPGDPDHMGIPEGELIRVWGYMIPRSQTYRVRPEGALEEWEQAEHVLVVTKWKHAKDGDSVPVARVLTPRRWQ